MVKAMLYKAGLVWMDFHGVPVGGVELVVVVEDVVAETTADVDTVTATGGGR